MSYTSFKQAILLLAASELLLADKAEAGECIKAGLEAERGSEAQAAALCMADE